jgi:ABC-2 type transport system permease protein
VANLLITPLALLGGVFYSAERLEAPWQALTRFDPIYYLVDATRGGWTGINDASIAVALAVAAAAAVALYAVAVALVARGWRLKP